MTANASMVFYAPKFFKSLIQIDKKIINLEQSFHMKTNIKNICTKFEGKGGRR